MTFWSTYRGLLLVTIAFFVAGPVSVAREGRPRKASYGSKDELHRKGCKERRR